MKITVLMENRSPDGLLHEHGLSLHIAYRGGSYLLDGGASGRFVKNAESLGIDLTGVEAAALSHGHWDHADGLTAFCEINSRAKIYARPAVREPQYSAGESIGVDPSLFERFGDHFDLCDGPRELAPGLHLIPDAVEHEQSLVAETGQGLVVMNSCCHAGAGHIVKDILARFPGQRVYAILGGFHLMGRAGVESLGVSPGIVRNLAHWLSDELGVARIYTGHCTGAPAFSILKEELGERVDYLQTGNQIGFDG